VTHSTRHLAIIAAVVVLVVCGYVSKPLAAGEWREVGEAQPLVEAPNGGFVVTTSVPGDGPVVGAGDLAVAWRPLTASSW
jgi:hypothetical protein